MKSSVIIPIYNTGDYLRPCVESVLRQTYSDIEVILVDDGSELYTSQICDQLAGEDLRIKVIHQANQGVSIARNTGLRHASGQVICFVDSDDTIRPEMFATLMAALIDNNAQIALCDTITITPGQPDELDTFPMLTKSCVLDKNQITPAMLTLIAGSACRCAYKRIDMREFDNIKFPEGIKFSEDRIFNILAISKASRIAYVKTPFYNRLIRKGSACFRFYPDITVQISAMRQVLLTAVKSAWGNEFVQTYEQQIAGHILYAITNLSSPDNKLSLARQYALIKQHCACMSIRDCIIASNDTSLRATLILRNKPFFLTLIGRLTNIYHKLCKIGQYR